MKFLTTLFYIRAWSYPNIEFKKIADSKIVEHWVFMDQLALLKQLGIM